MQAPRKVHLTSKVYLGGWAPDGMLRPVSVTYGPQKLKAPAAIGWAMEWWGGGDPVLNRVCEEACGKLETRLPDAFGALASSWPLSAEERNVIAHFLALHVLRSHAFRGWFELIRERSLAELGVERFRSRGQRRRFEQVMRSDRERGKKLISLMNKLATIFGSMHWTLLRFSEPVLLTSDQPVSAVPILDPGEIVEVAAIPDTGWLHTCEIRCPLTPRIALLGSWWMGLEGAPIEGTWQQAVNLNTATRVQAVRYSFHTPERLPAVAPAIFREPPAPVLSAISPDVLSGYGNHAARESSRRALAMRTVRDLVERQDHQTVTVVTAAAPTAP
jgi:Protein of unknown function (DUF4238)